MPAPLQWLLCAVAQGRAIKIVYNINDKHVLYML